ncbi:MAG: PP2C family protein-serine/threonine phosphatase, partial [bacterium]
EAENPYALGSIGFIIAMSVYLSRDFARTNKNLEIQLVQVKELSEKAIRQERERAQLEAENARKSKELEEARQLQLSMLPKNPPSVPHLEIAADMITATEVGGDYYDFKMHDNGTLTAVIGDATGHGLQAGTMVAATKSLFNALADEPEPIEFLKKGTKAIKAMGLKKMFMALTIAKFKDHQMQIAAAGMPFTLIYRSSTGRVEEVALKGMPLGGFTNFPYKDKKLDMSAGDTVLFLSDGFEEMFNPQDEMLGEERVKVLFEQTAANSPEEIIEHLKKAGEAWASGRAQQDDVTFVVVKIK